MDKLKHVLLILLVYAILAFSIYTAFTMDDKTAESQTAIYIQGNQ